MNCTNANQMNIAGFLQSRGFRPVKVAGNSFWYCSPLREEKTPSFKVDRVKNLWYDFGTATGGRLLDLVCRIYNVELPGALLILSGQRIIKPVLSFSDKPSSRSFTEPKLEIVRIQPLQNMALIQYLDQRKISYSVASLHCKEAYYRTYAEGREFYSVAFENDRHGWELRSKYFKGSTSPKEITTIRGKDSTRVNVFEGFMDYLSALSYYQTKSPACDTIILNGVGFVEKFMAIVNRYSRINLYLDNDKAGREACQRIQSLRPDALNQSQRLYPDHKDFNEFLLGQPGRETRRINP
jgi:DNA primase